ncbi:MAG: rhomboid family intramembrane serine protease [Planctomycetaceae bacterium]|nr:rhomboid family intramembrane serine protease [Planctomycetaceae bacterium]
MRRIGSLSDKEAAETFRDYLLTQEIESDLDAAGDEWAIWVHDEDRIEETKSELDQFRENPQADKYRKAIVEADRLRHAKVQKAIAAKKSQINLSRQWNRPLIAKIPVTFTLIVLSAIITLGTQYGKKLDAFGGQVSIVPQMTRVGDYTKFPANYRQLPGVTNGQVWRLVTPAFIHFDPIHLILDVYWLAIFGGMIERVRGRRSMILLFLLTAIVGNLVQLYWNGPAFGGMSGVDAGLFGFIWISGQMDPSGGLTLPQHLVFIMLGFLMLATTGLMGPIANGAHLGGLFAGMGAAAATVTLKRIR